MRAGALASAAAAAAAAVAVAAAAVVSAPAAAVAGEPDGLYLTGSVCTLGGLTTSIAAIVYALNGRAFGSGWVVASLFSSAICVEAAVTAGINGNADPGALIGASLLAVLALWPASYTAYSAWSGAPPGELLPPEGEVVPRDSARAISGFSAPIVSLRF